MVQIKHEQQHQFQNEHIIDAIPSRKHTFIILTPLKHYFYIVKLEFTGDIHYFLSLLATASRLYAIAWGFLLRHKRIFITAIFIRALLLNQTQCGTITAN